MRTRKAYIDTNVFIYAAVHHPSFGPPCARVLREAYRGSFTPCGSLLVAVELLGAMSRLRPSAARRVVEDYFLIVREVLPLTVEVLELACIVNEVVNLRYDAIHLAVMALGGVEVVITYDVDDWHKAAKRFRDIVDLAGREGFELKISRLVVVTPDELASKLPRP